jgi:alanyl-tRNA synthetase
MALFGEKYDDEVRVLTMGNNSYSVELCGGTHVSRTGDIGHFIITNQSNVASGIRRIEALAGFQSIEYINNVRETNSSLQSLLNVSSEDMHEKILSLIEENKALKKKSSNKNSAKTVLLSETHDVKDWQLIVEQVEISDTKDLRGLVDEKKKINDKACIVILNHQKNKVAFVCGVTANLTETISAKDVINQLSKTIDGKGGGRSDFAQGAGETDNISDFVTSVVNTVKSLAK